MISNRATSFWAMFNSQLIIYPKVNSGTEVEITGVLSPPEYTDEDLYKEIVKIPASADEVQGLSPAQTKLLRYCVLKRLFEDKRDYAGAQYVGGQIRLLRHEMRATHSDPEYTGSVGTMLGDGNG